MMPKVLSHDPGDTEYRERSVKGVRLFVSEAAMNDMIHHCESGGGNEVMGLMVGRAYKDGHGTYVTVVRVITSGLVSDSVSVRFDQEDMSELFDAIDGLGDDETVTGWYHSHPGLGCFMSETDVRTHIGAFGDDRFAIVIDPTCREISAFGSTDGMVGKIDLVIMED
jgi:proteasome lid subunit RPN8/RPN11